jgi:hypothetical protein
MAGEWHGHGMLCVNRSLDCYSSSESRGPRRLFEIPETGYKALVVFETSVNCYESIWRNMTHDVNVN